MDAGFLFIAVISDQMHAVKLLTDLIQHPELAALFSLLPRLLLPASICTTAGFHVMTEM